MPVERFRSVEHMNHASVRGSADADIERFLRHCARYRVIAPTIYPRGVFKFRSIDEAAEFSAARHVLPGDGRDTS